MTTTTDSKLMQHAKSGVIYRVFGNVWRDSKGKERIAGYAQKNGADFGPYRRLLLGSLKS